MVFKPDRFYCFSLVLQLKVKKDSLAGLKGQNRWCRADWEERPRAVEPSEQCVCMDFVAAKQKFQKWLILMSMFYK